MMSGNRINATRFDPFQFDYLSYYDQILQFNSHLQQGLSDELCSLIDNAFNGYVIGTTGSDARLEKGPVSLLELVVYAKSVQESDSLISVLSDYCSSAEGIRIVEQDIEIKLLGSGRMYETIIFTKAGEQRAILSPNRVFDYLMLCGEKSVYSLALEQFSQEIIEEKRVFNQIKAKTKQHKRLTITGKQRFKGDEICHYDLEQGCLYYDPDKSLWGIKQGPLRLVQYAIVRDSIKSIREGVSPDKVYGLPRNTVSKLNRLYLQSNLVLGIDEFSDLCDNYKFFLHMYHCSQKNYNQDGVTCLEFDANEIKERLESLVLICSDQLFKF